MDNKILIGFILFLVVFLVLPIALNKSNQPDASSSNTPSPSGGAAENTAAANHPEVNQPPLLNEHTIVGTNWQIGEHKIKVNFAAGGVCYFTHPLAQSMIGRDYVEMRYRLAYDKLYVDGSFGGKEEHYELKISGNDLYTIKGNDIKKIERI